MAAAKFRNEKQQITFFHPWAQFWRQSRSFAALNSCSAPSSFAVQLVMLLLLLLLSEQVVKWLTGRLPCHRNHNLLINFISMSRRRLHFCKVKVRKPKAPPSSAPLLHIPSTIPTPCALSPLTMVPNAVNKAPKAALVSYLFRTAAKNEDERSKTKDLEHKLTVDIGISARWFVVLIKSSIHQPFRHANVFIMSQTGDSLYISSSVST